MTTADLQDANLPAANSRREPPPQPTAQQALGTTERQIMPLLLPTHFAPGSAAPKTSPQPDAAEIYRVAFRSTDAPFESSHEYALGVVYKAGLKAGRRVEVTA